MHVGTYIRSTSAHIESKEKSLKNHKKNKEKISKINKPVRSNRYG